MRLNIGRSKNQKYYYVQKTVYIDGKEKSLIVEKLGSHTSLLKKLNGEDPLEWAKKYVEELNRKEQEEKEKHQKEVNDFGTYTQEDVKYGE